MTSRLSLYNDALLLCGERMLSNLTEEREPRRLLDQVWNSGGVNGCLEEGQWHFAMRTAQIDYDPDIEPDFGYQHAFTKPTDWVLTSALCEDEFFNEPLLQYSDEAGYWYSELDTIYVRYVSDDDTYGLNLNSWPSSFSDFVAADFASRIILKLSSDTAKHNMLIALREQSKKNAKNRAAMADPSKIPVQGNWSKARMRGGRRYRDDQGNPV